MAAIDHASVFLPSGSDTEESCWSHHVPKQDMLACESLRKVAL